MKNFILKRITILAVFAASIFTVMPISAFAYSEPEEVVEEISDPVETKEEPIAYDPLTPEGNLSLVDDYGDSEKVGKQFVTLVTKNGNYFYLIIDRDDNGQENVHFLNLVDESDLLSLMDEEEAQAYIDEHSTKEEIPVIEEPIQEKIGRAHV